MNGWISSAWKVPCKSFILSFRNWLLYLSQAPILLVCYSLVRICPFVTAKLISFLPLSTIQLLSSELSLLSLPPQSALYSSMPQYFNLFHNLAQNSPFPGNCLINPIWLRSHHYSGSSSQHTHNCLHNPLNLQIYSFAWFLSHFLYIYLPPPASCKALQWHWNMHLLLCNTLPISPLASSLKHMVSNACWKKWINDI